ncbi:WD40 repeat-like protein [Schizopora paradoxa]|uniref:WD40 repeat-like protein n=1 Tax=Schizopora paradoxa TaxID=27342 RepID=A0A0H2S1U6_9AGAM|nr:WD40 repeat-like protein [Schizopora paradoxa]
MPIVSPPTPAPSPRPLLATNDDAVNWARVVFAHLKALGASARHQFLDAILTDCSPSELLFIHTKVTPLLKRDFLKDLPFELATYILTFVDDPKTLARSCRVSKSWNSIICEEDSVWKLMRDRCDVGEERIYPNTTPHVPFSHRRYLMDCYRTLINWRRKGRLLNKHRPPAVTSDGSVVTTVAMDHDWIALGLASSHIQVFSARTGVLSRTLIGHESGVWSVNIASSGGFWVNPPRTLFEEEQNMQHSNPEKVIPEDLQIAIGLDERFRDSHHAAPCVDEVPPKASDPCFASEGWGQSHALVVSGGCDKNLRVWDAVSGRCIHILRGHSSTIRCMRLLHNRPIAVSGARDGTLRVWDVQRGKLLRSLTGHSSSVRCLDVYGNRAISGSYDCTCRLWNLDTGECLHELRGHMHQVYSVAFRGNIIASGGLDTTVRLWNPETGQCLALLQGHTALVCQMQFSDDSTTLCTGGSDGRIITFSMGSMSAQRRIAAHDSSVTALQFDKDFIVTGGADGRVRLYDTPTGNFVRDLTEPAEAVWKVAFKHDKCAILCKRAGKTVMEIWSYRPSEADD